MKLVALVYLLALTKYGTARRGKKHRAVIKERPKDVTEAKCGDEIIMACTAEGDPQPDVEWWYYGQARDGAMKLEHKQRNGRVHIKVEKFYVVRSTIVLNDAESSDMGVYQCRTSNSNGRRKEGENLYKHWTIEEAPVMAMNCDEDNVIGLVTEKVVDATTLNDSANFNELTTTETIMELIDRGTTQSSTTEEITIATTNHFNVAISEKVMSGDEPTTQIVSTTSSSKGRKPTAFWISIIPIFYFSLIIS